MSMALFIVGGGAAGALLYHLLRAVRTFWAWMTNTEKPKERPIPFTVLGVIFGGTIGFLVHMHYSCMSSGNGILGCFPLG